MSEGVHLCITPELLHALTQMECGDTIVLVDRHFKAEATHDRILNSAGWPITTMMGEILARFDLDTAADAIVMMKPVVVEYLYLQTESRYMHVLHSHVPEACSPIRLDADEFVERVRKAFAIVMTGDIIPSSSIILRKGIDQTKGVRS